MKRISTVLLLLGSSLVASNSIADSLDFNVHNDAMRAIYTMDLSKRGHAGLSAEFGLLYSEDKRRLDDILLHAGMHVSGENWSESGTFNIRLGGRLIHSSPADLDLIALAPGVQLRFSPAHRVGLGGHLYFAPKILSFGDAERYREYAVRADYQVLPQAFVYVGYRYIDVNIEDGPSSVELDKSVHMGLKMLF